MPSEGPLKVSSPPTHTHPEVTCDVDKYNKELTESWEAAGQVEMGGSRILRGERSGDAMLIHHPAMP